MSFVFNILGRKRKREQTQIQEVEEIVIEDTKYRLGHEKKHFLHTRFIERIKQMIWTDKPATFNVKFRDNYREYLKIAIQAYAINRTVFVCLGEIVGVDQGTDKKAEWTSVVEVYREYDNKYHMRPKAESWLVSDNESVCHQANATCTKRTKHKCRVITEQ